MIRSLLLKALTLLGSISVFLSPSSSPAQDKGWPGLALSLNGVDSYCAAAIPVMTNNFTICTWALLRSGGQFSATRIGILSGPTCGSTLEFLVRSATTNATDTQYLELGRCGFFNGPASQASVPLNQWVHLAVCMDEGRNVTYYINGEDSGTRSVGTGDTTLGPLVHLGDNGVRKFDGMLDEFQIWSRALSKAEIQSIMSGPSGGREDGLVVYWRFEGNATNSAASTGTACDGTLVNSPVYVASGIPFPPEIIRLTASVTSVDTATLIGEVNPGNLQTAVWVNWGETTGYDSRTAPIMVAAANEAKEISFDLTCLKAAHVYHGQLCASNSAGIAFGHDFAWTNPIQPPVLTTLAATNITKNSVAFQGCIDAKGIVSACWFTWGRDTNYGLATALVTVSAEATNQLISGTLTGLASCQNYHYRLVGTNKAGIAYGEDVSFRTYGATNVVTTLADSGPGSLRQTIADSNPEDTIVFATNGTMTLTTGELVIDKSLNLFGTGATNLILSGNNSSRVFHITSAAAVVVINDLAITHGKAPDGVAGVNGSNGGGILNEGSFTLNGCLVSSSRAGNGGFGGDGAGGDYYHDGGTGGTGGNGGHGGGIYSWGPLTMSRCSVVSNAAGTGGKGGTGGIGGTGTDGGKGGAGGTGGTGAGICSLGGLTLDECTVASNTSGDGGTGGTGGRGGNGVTGGEGGDGGFGGTGGVAGGVYADASLNMTACTVVNNSGGTGGAGASGGAAGSGGGSIGTKGGGGAGGSCGGLMSRGGATLHLVRNSLLAQNTAGSGGSGNPAGAIGTNPDVSGAFSSKGHNFIRLAGDSSGFVGGMKGDIVGNVNPQLGPLSYNGGPTPTIALLPASLLIDAGDDALADLTDQRGFSRASGLHTDIGAYEWHSVPIQAAGFALYLDGPSDQYALVEDNDALTFTNAFTWEAWISISKSSWGFTEEWATILAKDTFTGEDWFSIYSDGIPEIRLAGQSFVLTRSSSAAVAFNTWQHVAVTWDGTNVLCYVNGVARQAQPYSGSNGNTTASLVIGKDLIHGYRYTGYLDEMRLWNRVRTENEIASAMCHPLAGSEPGLVGYWNFDDGSGSTATNAAALTGSTCNATLYNSPTFVPSSIPFIPVATALGPSNVGDNSATLNAMVYPGNQETSVWFEYGTDTNYGNVTATTIVTAGTDGVSIQTLLGGLVPGWTYHYRVVASNAGGKVLGSDRTVTTTLSAILTLAQCTLQAAAQTFTFDVLGGSSQTVVVECSSDLAGNAWQPLQTNTLTGGTTTISTPVWKERPRCFYRLRVQ